MAYKGMWQHKDTSEAFRKWFTGTAQASDGIISPAKEPPEQLVIWIRIYCAGAWCAALAYAEEQFTAANKRKPKSAVRTGGKRKQTSAVR
jgi:tryptophan-rich sensory protein